MSWDIKIKIKIYNCGECLEPELEIAHIKKSFYESYWNRWKTTHRKINSRGESLLKFVGS
jgi:hypothetical protein